jgi:hypothetical protein
MAANNHSQGSSVKATDNQNDEAVVYIMPQRIQKRMLQDLKNGAKRIKLQISEHFG